MQPTTPSGHGLIHSPLPSTSETDRRIFSLFQRARFLQSQGATKENDYELFQISQQLELLQNAQPLAISIPHQAANNERQNSLFSPSQLTILRHQILTYKLLSKNAPIPWDLQQNVLAPSFHTLKPEYLPSAPAINKPSPYQQSQSTILQKSSATKPNQAVSQQFILSPKPEAATVLKSSINTPKAYNSYIPPSKLLKKPIPSYIHKSVQHKIIIPSLMPSGIDPEYIRSQRAKRIRCRLQHITDSQQASKPTHVKQIIQAKALKLLQKQSKIRDILVNGMSKSTTLVTSVDRATFSLKKKVLSLKDAHQGDEQGILSKRKHRPYEGDQKKNDDVQSQKRRIQEEEDSYVRQQLTKIFNACYKAVEEAVEEDEEDVTYRLRCELFIDLVDKTEYPEYYTIIKNPISMSIIKKRIQAEYYNNVVQFENDFRLMFDNARLFNEEDSTVYEDANIMQKVFEKELEKQCQDSTLPVKLTRRTRTRSSSRSGFNRAS